MAGLTPSNLRKHFIDAEVPGLIRFYKLHKSLDYDDTARDIAVGGVPLGDYLFPRFQNDPEFCRLVVREADTRRDASLLGIRRMAESPGEASLRGGYRSHFDYEGLLLDSTVAFGTIAAICGKPEAVVPQDGRTYYEENIIIMMKRLGNRLAAGTPPFGQYTAAWYAEMGNSRYSMYDILVSFNEAFVARMEKDVETFGTERGISDPDDVVDFMLSTRIEQSMRRGRSHGALAEVANDILPLVRLARTGLRYNEESRIIRGRFLYWFVNGCIASAIRPLDFYEELNEERTNA